MIGNDVVDLVDDEAREAMLHERFDVRVFTESERATIEASDSRHRARWMLWAAKESAFKVVKRRVPATIFAPLRFVTAIGSDLTGRVYHEGRRYPVRVALDDDHVHAVATEPGGSLEQVLAGVHRWVGSLPPAPTADRASDRAREFALREIAARIGVPATALEIERRDRIPHLVVHSGDLPLALSLSHHGRFVAYACAARSSGGLA